MVDNLQTIKYSLKLPLLMSPILTLKPTKHYSDLKYICVNSNALNMPVSIQNSTMHLRYQANKVVGHDLY